MYIDYENNPLKRRRKKQGLSQKEMGDALNITQSQYSRIESGETDPDKYLNHLATLLQCKPNEIFSGDILREIEDDFLFKADKKSIVKWHERKPDYIHLDISGWQNKDDVRSLIIMLQNEEKKLAKNVYLKEFESLKSESKTKS